jgi:hypothetical protein
MRRVLFELGALLFLLVGGPVQAQVTCRKVLQDIPVRVEATPARMTAILQALKQLNPKALAMEELPKWQDFEVLAQLIRQLKSGIEPSVATFTVTTPEQFRNSLETDIQPLFKVPPAHVYKATEFQLQSELRRMIGELNRLLPVEVRVKLPPLPDQNRPLRTQLQARAVMNSVQEQFARLFSTTGFKDLNEYKKAVEERGDAELKATFDLLEKGEFELSMRRPENSRFWLPKVGFHNQFVTGSSRGYFTPSGRNHCEAGWTGVRYEVYEKLNPETKPKYGSIRPRPEDANSKPANSESGYGSDIFILKTERVKDRLTFNIGDSNGLLSHNNKSGKRWEENVNQAQAWDQSFIPWNYRTLLAPFLQRAAFGRPQPQSNPILQKTWTMDHTYFEIQIFGELTLNDVKAYEFTQTPPSGEFLKTLRDHGIEIRDGRTWPPKPWAESYP